MPPLRQTRQLLHRIHQRLVKGAGVGRSSAVRRHVAERQNAVSAVPGVSDVKVNMVFDPPWDQSRMSDEARVALDMW